MAILRAPRAVACADMRRTIIPSGHDGGMSDEHMLPSEDPDLAEVWKQMTPTERLQYQLAEGEPVPEELRERVRRAYRERRGD